MPDVVCEFSGARLMQQGAARVHVSGVRGRPLTADYKVCATHDDGFRATFIQTLTSFDAPRRARANAEAILSVARRRLAHDRLPDFRDTAIHLIGTNTLWNPAYRPPIEANEMVLRVDVWHERYAGCEVFSKEAAGAALSMTTGHCAAGPTGRPKTTPVVRPFSFLLPKTEVPVRVAVDGQAVEFAWQSFVAAPAMQAAPALKIAEPLTAQGDTVTVPLIRLAVARSGDKGDKSNIGVLARQPECLPYLSAALTADVVRDWFAHTGTPRVDRYELPGLNGLNFLLHDALGGGGAVSLRLDVQGKTFAQQLLHFPVTVPWELLGGAA